MALHPEEPKRHVPVELPVAWDPIRRDLEENKDWYRDLVEHSQDLLCVHDLDGRFLSVNPVPARLLGYSVEEGLHMRLQDVIDPQFRAQCEDYLRDIERTGESHGLMAVMTRSGERRIWEYHNTLRTEGVERPVVLGMAHDITEQRRLEGALKKSEERYRSVVMAMAEGVLLRDADGTILACNQSFERMLGVTSEQMVGTTAADWEHRTIREDESPFPGEDHPAMAALRTGKPQSNVRMGFRRPDGGLTWISINAQPIFRSGESKPYAVLTTFADITEQKRAEEELHKSEERYRSVVAAMAEGVVLLDADGTILACNESGERILGLTREELQGQTAVDLEPNCIHEDGSPFPAETHPAMVTLRTGQPQTNVCMGVGRPQGGTSWISINSQPLFRGGEQAPYAVVTSFMDITDRKRAAALLAESEKRFRAVHERAPVGIALVDAHSGRFLQVNPKLCEIAGRSEEEMLRLRYADITHPEDRADAAERTRQLLEEKVRAYDTEKRYVRPDGTVVRVSLSVVPMWAPGQDAQLLMTMAQDITERRQAEEALEKSEAELREAQRVAQMGNWRLNLRTQAVTGSEQMFRIMGLDPMAAPLPFSELGHFFLPESWQQIVEANGRAIHTGRPEAFEVAFRRPDGTAGWLQVRAETDTDGADNIIGLHGIALDITERGQAEEALRESEERLRLAQEAAQIGVFDRNFKTGKSRWTPQMEALFGLAPGEFPRTQDKFLELVHPDDRQQVTQRLAQSRESGEAKGEWRVIWPDGTVHWISGRWRVFKDASGNPERAIGVDFDITERKQVEENLRQAKERLTEEKLYLEQEINTELGFEDIIGQSKALKTVMESVGKVATSDATVLLLGETGTGKELVARAIHRLSQRAGNAFIKMNCAAIPSGLLESELFGNEKGAFTGAVSKKIGRLELADKGTLFLDEIGEISLALQPKLLRVLQDHEFERLGGTQTLKVNFRLIAATNRDLAEAVRECEFRSDLYYRLNVFPISLPPLRERRDDIPLLVEHFVQKIARRMNKSITSIPKKTMDALVGWNWPGNVRELENFVERSLILTNGSVLAAPLSELQPAAGEKSEDETLKAKEFEHILRALRESHGQIGGVKGAAMRLGLRRTTLQSKLKHLGIDPRSPRPGQ